jgi:hypothetical protein
MTQTMLLPDSRVQGAKTCNLRKKASTGDAPVHRTAHINAASRPDTYSRVHSSAPKSLRFKGGEHFEENGSFLETVLHRLTRFVQDLAKAVRKLFGGETQVAPKLQMGGEIRKAIQDTVQNPELSEQMKHTGEGLEKVLPDLEVSERERGLIHQHALLLQTPQGQHQLLEENLLESLQSGYVRQEMQKSLAIMNNAIGIKDGDGILRLLTPKAPVNEHGLGDDIDSGYEGEDDDWSDGSSDNG